MIKKTQDIILRKKRKRREKIGRNRKEVKECCEYKISCKKKQSKIKIKDNNSSNQIRIAQKYEIIQSRQYNKVRLRS